MILYQQNCIKQVQSKFPSQILINLAEMTNAANSSALSNVHKLKNVFEENMYFPNLKRVMVFFLFSLNKINE